MMKIAPDLLQIQADLVEVAESLERMRATVKGMLERQRAQEGLGGIAHTGLPRAPAGVVQDGAGVHLAQD